MTVIKDPTNALGAGLDAIRAQFKVPEGFPQALIDAAGAAAERGLDRHVDRTSWDFVTLDPAGSTDLDQAFAVARAGDDVVLHYAIADVAWFVDDGSPLDAEAWARGATQYLPDRRALLYPEPISEGAASLLPDARRPAVVFHVRVAPDGAGKLDGVERSVVRSRAKLAYDSVQPGDLPDGFADLARRVQRAETARGASRVEPPEQEVVARRGGRYELQLRPRKQAEEDNAAMSLVTNLVVADALYAAGTGLFRVMDPPDDRAITRLRHTARALGLRWPGDVPLERYERTLDGNDPKQAAMMLAIRRAGGGARYEPYSAGVKPWHAAMAATYCHATAPLRRLADRYVVLAALAVANGEALPERCARAFAELPAVMERADQLGNQLERAVIELAEAAILHGREGQTFAAVVTDVDDRGARIQLADLPVVTRVDAKGVEPGDDIRVKLLSTDVAQRKADFTRVA